MPPKKSGSDVILISSWSKEDKYSGLDVFKIAEELLKNWNISEKDLAAQLGIDVGRKSSGVGDIKRLVKDILQLGWNYTEKNPRPDKARRERWEGSRRL